jgi:hypothetical protein
LQYFLFEQSFQQSQLSLEGKQQQFRSVTEKYLVGKEEKKQPKSVDADICFLFYANFIL